MDVKKVFEIIAKSVLFVLILHVYAFVFFFYLTAMVVEWTLSDLNANLWLCMDRLCDRKLNCK